MSYSVNGNSCNYVTLTDYNSSSPGMLGHPAVPATTVTGHYVVPDYKPITYDALTHGDGNQYGCSGYFNVTNGYGLDAANCNTQYSQRPCNGTLGGDANKFRGTCLFDNVYESCISSKASCGTVGLGKSGTCRNYGKPNPNTGLPLINPKTGQSNGYFTCGCSKLYKWPTNDGRCSTCPNQ